MKKAIKVIGITFAAFFLLIAGYASYLFVTYDRIADMQELSIIQPQDNRICASILAAWGGI